MTITNPFDKFSVFTIGFDDIFENIKNSIDNNPKSYPPHNIIAVSDTEFNLELAIAGFKKEEITIEEEDSVLTVKGNKPDSDEDSYQYRGIAKRNFTKSFRIAEHFEIGNATLEDGILTIFFKKNAPLSQVKVIAIK